METKKWYLSKTLWLNVLAGVATLVQTQTGLVADPELQGALLVIANIVLRAISKTALTK